MLRAVKVANDHENSVATAAIHNSASKDHGHVNICIQQTEYEQQQDLKRASLQKSSIQESIKASEKGSRDS